MTLSQHLDGYLRQSDNLLESKGLRPGETVALELVNLGFFEFYLSEAFDFYRKGISL
jgi:hypothetical protein